MKILLLGEFSSLHKYLKEGLIAIGIEQVYIASTGDSWKKIGGSDFAIPTYNHDGLVKYLLYLRRLTKFIKELKNYDVIQVITTGFFPRLLGKKLFRILKKNNKKIVFVSAGASYHNYLTYKDHILEYNPHMLFDEKDILYNHKNFAIKKKINDEIYITKNAYEIIPSLWEYKLGYENFNVTKCVPFPINYNELKYEENIVKEKIVFFHGLNNEKAKGTKFIRAAFERLSKNYPNDVECIIDGKMPFDEYVKLLKRTNVVVDQCCAYGYGINACIAMAQGKVVVSGCRKETLNAFGLDDTPMILAKPDVDYLYHQFEWIIKNRDKISEIGEKSRKYIETIHNYKNIAKEYYDLWNK